jgi:hypothetical protein
VTPVQALLEARKQGATVSVRAGKLHVRAGSPLSPDLVAELRTHREALVTMLTIEEAPQRAAEPPVDEQRFSFAVRWGRERGWLQVRDAFSGEWLEVLATACPPWWREEAFRAKRRGHGDSRG